MAVTLFAILALSLCYRPAPLWTRHVTRPPDSDFSCYTDANGTVWCAQDARLREDVDADDSY